MMLLAEMSGAEHVAVVGAITLGVIQVLTLLKSFYSDWLSDKRAAAAALLLATSADHLKQETEKHAAEVKETLRQQTETQAAHLGKQDETLQGLTENVEQVRIASDGMKESLVNATDRAAGAIGELKGRADQKAETSSDTEEVVNEGHETSKELTKTLKNTEVIKADVKKLKGDK